MFLKNLTINKNLSDLFQKQSLVDYLGQGRRIGLLDVVSEELESRNLITKYINDDFKKKVFDSIHSFIHSKNYKQISAENKTDINYWFDLYQIARNENRDDLASDCLIPVFESNLDIHEKMNYTANASALCFILGDDYVPRSEIYIEKIIYQPNSEEKISYEYAFLACIYGIILIKKTDHIETALHFLEESRKILKLLDRKLQLEIHSSMLITLGTQYFNAEPPDFENAINIFKESIDLYKDETKISISEAESYYRLAYALITQPGTLNSSEFNKIIDKSINLYSQLNDLESLALSKTLKLIYFLNQPYQGDNDDAISLAEQLLTYNQEIQKPFRINQIKYYLAHFYQRKNETEKAIQLAEEAKNYFWDSGPKSILVEILTLLDSLYPEGNNQRARNLFHLAKLHGSEPNPNWDLAIASLKQAIEIFKLTKSIEELAGTHHRLARIYLKMPVPNLIDAEKEFLIVIDLYQNNDLKKARILFELVQYYEQIQNHIEAYRFAEMASAILSKSKEYSEEYASILYKQSQLLIKIKPINFDKSIDLSKQALALFLEQKDRREIGVINHHLGNLYSKKPNPEYSISFEHYEKSLKILNSLELNQVISQELFIVLLDYTFSLLSSKSNPWHIKAINNLESVINILEQFFDLEALERCCLVFERIIENMNRSQCSQAISLGEKIYHQTQAISNLNTKIHFLITLIHTYQESQSENKERIKSLLFECLDLILQEEEEVNFSALFSIVGMLSSKEEILPNYSNVYPIMEKGINDLIE